MTSTTVIFYYGVASRYSYLASTQIAALEEETGWRVRWLPICSRDPIRQGGDPFDELRNYGDTLLNCEGGPAHD